MPVYKDKNKHWYFVVTVDYKQYKKIKYNGCYMMSKVEAQACEQEFKKKIIGYTNGDMYFIDLFNEYVKASKSSLKESTLNNYNKFRRNYIENLKDKKIHKITPNDIIEWRFELSKVNATATYKNRNQNILKKVLEYGSIMYDLSGRLQFALLQPFKDNEVREINNKTKYLEIENFKRMLAPLKQDDYYYKVLWLLYFTGLRIGELTALTVSDVKNGYISVNKDYIRVNGKDYIQAPKNKNSIRIVPMDEITNKMIQEHIKELNDNEILFHQKSKYLNQQKIRRVIEKLQAEASLDNYIITPHTLRHSYSSNLKKLGYDEYTISKLMGNTPEVASSTYIHTNLDFDEISKKIGNLK